MSQQPARPQNLADAALLIAVSFQQLRDFRFFTLPA
jgi:hypothetical protein